MNSNPQPILICIPDISGFTQFMSETSIETSSKVIPTLLNNIIYANEIGLKISEIEGDAVLFYSNTELPSFVTLVNQCRRFYLEFYKRLNKLKKDNPDNSEIRDLPESLGLKIILHFGNEINPVTIGKNIKLMGEDVIVAHRLLKNDIQSDEYLLISDALLERYNPAVIERNLGWGELKVGHTNYEHIGNISYSYILLEPLLED